MGTNRRTIPLKDNHTFFHVPGLQDVCCQRVILTLLGVSAVISFPAAFSSLWPVDYCLPKPPRCAETLQSLGGAAAGAEPRSARQRDGAGIAVTFAFSFWGEKAAGSSLPRSTSTTLAHDPVLQPAWWHQDCALQHHELIRKLPINCSRFWTRVCLTSVNLT